MPIDKSFSSVFSLTHEVDFSECDPSGYLKINELCKIIQKVATKHSVLGGISFWDLQAVHQAWVLNKMRMEISALPQWQDHIEIKTWIAQLDGVRSIRNFEVYFKGQKKIGISTLWVIINTKRRRPEPMKLPHAHFEKFPDRPATLSPFSNDTLLFTNPTQIAESKVSYSDLDMLNHVTNTKYIEWIWNAMYANGISFENPRHMEMNFRKEIRFQEEYVILYSKEQRKSGFQIVGSDRKLRFSCWFE